MVDITGTTMLYAGVHGSAYSGDIDLLNDSLKAVLLDSSYVPDPAHVDLSDIAAFEIAGNGYARQTLGGVSIGYVSPWTVVSCNNFAFTASGGDLTCRYWAIFDDSHVDDILLVSGLVNATDEDTVIVDGQPLTIRINENGLFRISRLPS